MKINVVGTSASGKSTLCQELANNLGIPHIEMDKLFWKPNWTKSSDNEFNSKLESVLSQESWILDGNYTRTTPIKWRDVDIVIWTDYSFSRVLFQSVTRTVNRLFKNVELWEETGNKESIRRLLSRDSIVWWAISSYGKNKRKYSQIMAGNQFPHIEFIRVNSPKEASAVVQELKNRQKI